MRAARYAALLALCGLGAWLAHGWAERHFLEETRERALASLGLYAESLEGALRKHEVIPALLAGRAEVADLFRDRAEAATIGRANRLAETVNRTVGAEEVYFMAPDGLTFAASNWAGERPFVGQNFSYRPYFKEAMAGRSGRYFALGTTSGKRGYYFAHPVEAGGEILGAVVVKMDVEGIEAALASGADRVMATDAKGVVFLASEPAWRFKTLAPLGPDAVAEIERDRQYPMADLTPLSLERRAGPGGDFALVKVSGADGLAEYLVESRDLAEAGLTVHILADTRWARSQVATTVLISLLAGLLAVTLFAVADQRRRRLIERIEIEKAAAARLERRVVERTADLSESNLRLEREVGERKAAEAELRRTQDELVQAGKLAALGQMSAAISHEFNQPLAAIRSYAENAAKLIERGRTPEAGENCGRIRELTGRMAEIGKHLQTFARRPRSERVPVSPEAAVDEALAVLRDRLEAGGVGVTVERPAKALTVMAGPVRLQQVLTNLLTNALEAMAEAERPRIEIALRREGETAVLTVRDHGPGIAPETLPRLFEPFHTTKRVGLGLGLAITNNIIRDFGGDLRAENHSEGGALFTLTLPIAPAAASTEAETERV